MKYSTACKGSNCRWNITKLKGPVVIKYKFKHYCHESSNSTFLLSSQLIQQYSGISLGWLLKLATSYIHVQLSVVSGYASFHQRRLVHLKESKRFFFFFFDGFQRLITRHIYHSFNLDFYGNCSRIYFISNCDLAHWHILACISKKAV